MIKIYNYGQVSDEEIFARDNIAPDVEGVVAEIVLASGESVVVGWSERFGFEQALRIKEMLFLSGKRPTDLPRVVLTLCSKDTKSAIV